MCGYFNATKRFYQPQDFRDRDIAAAMRHLKLPDLSGIDLEQPRFPHQPGASARAIPQPDWPYVHAELRRKGVTLALLWEEYRGVYPPPLDGMEAPSRHRFAKVAVSKLATRRKRR